MAIAILQDPHCGSISYPATNFRHVNNKHKRGRSRYLLDRVRGSSRGGFSLTLCSLCCVDG